MPANTAHQIFQQPTDPSAKLWRYMDFTKYVSLLESSALWFSRLDQLGDPFEGSWTEASERLFETMFQPGPETADAVVKFRKHYADGRKLFRSGTFVSCWHMGEHESAAMWRLYSKTDEAIAIQTTYAKLAQVLPDDYLLGRVQYVDYDHTAFSLDNILHPVTRKRLSFEHEREVRAIKLDVKEGSDQPLGVSVPVPLAAVVERVYVAPNSPAWYDDLVRKTTARFGWNFDIAPSRLRDRPIF